jgi:hypothetical protein
MTWVSSPLFNLTLRFNRFGRLALSRDERMASSWIGGCFLMALGLFVVYVVTGGTRSFNWMIFFGLLIFPLAVTFRQPIGKPRLLAALCTTALALIGATSLVLAMLGIGSIGGIRTTSLFMLFFGGSILSTWFNAFIGPGRIGR